MNTPAPEPTPVAATASSDTVSQEPSPRSWWRRASRPLAIAVAGLAAYGGPPLGYWLATKPNENWAHFFPVVATPYGTITAGFAAITAAAIALHNGREQRNAEGERDEKTFAQQQESMRAVEERATRELAHAQSVARESADAATVRDLHARFTSAAEQLAHGIETIQLAGAYALGSVTDDWLTLDNRQEAQVCIDVLYAYLRTHHLVNKRAAAYKLTEPPDDQTVRSAIVKLIARHCQTPPISPRANLTTPGAWSSMNFDLTGSHLVDADFSWTHFTGGQTYFADICFGGTARFDRAVFEKSEANFQGARFVGAVSFAHAQFGAGSDFSQAHFERGTNFIGTRFQGSTSFRTAQLADNVDFASAQFQETVYFSSTVFGTYVNFGRGNIFNPKTAPVGAAFLGEAWFTNVHFTGSTSFVGARFTNNATFMAARFLESSDTDFRGADFSHLTPGATVNFRHPGVWQSPPLVDWPTGPETAPEFIEPRDWPEAIVDQPVAEFRRRPHPEGA